MNPRIRLAIIAACAVLLLIARSRAGPATLPSATRPAKQFVFGEIHFDRTPLEKALATIAAQSHADVRVDWASLAGVGVARDKLLTLDLFDLPLTQVLELTLEQAGDDQNSRLNFEIRLDGVIRIASAADIKDVVARIYDVTDLVDPAAQAKASSDKRNTMTQQERSDVLRRMIEETIDINSWRDNGGQIGSIKEFAGFMFVTQTRRNQEAVAQFLLKMDRLRIARKAGPVTQPIDLPGTP